MTTRVIPLTCSGHTRPVVHLSFSSIQEEDGKFLLVSSCKDGNPMLRDWTGDWIGTFVGEPVFHVSDVGEVSFIFYHSSGHKGAVWSTKLSKDASKAATGSADFTSYVVYEIRSYLSSF